MCQKQGNIIKKCWFLAILGSFFLVMVSPVVAAGSDIKTSFYTIKQAIQNEDNTVIQSYVTQASLPAVNRLTAHKLGGCLPGELEYAGERREGNYMIATVQTPYTEGRVLSSELAFSYENNRWKLDVPESFRKAMGENWQEIVNQMESLYVMMQSQFGDVVNCTMVRELIKNTASS